MTILFEKILYNIYNILQKLNTNFDKNIGVFIPQLDISLDITVLDLLANYKNYIKEILEKKNLINFFDKLFEKSDNKEKIHNFIDIIKNKDKQYIEFYYEIKLCEKRMNEELDKPLDEIYLNIELNDHNIILLKKILKKFLLFNLIKLLRIKILDNIYILDTLYYQCGISNCKKFKRLKKSIETLKKELIKDFIFLSKVNQNLSYFIDLLCLIKLHNCERENDYLVYDKEGEIENEEYTCKLIPPKILLLFMNPKQITQLDILFEKELILILTKLCSSFIFNLQSECIGCSINILCEKIYNIVIQEKKNLVSFEEFYNIFNFEIYNKNKNYIKNLIETNLA